MRMGKGASSPRPFPWDEAIRFGLGVLRLPPEHFWKITPRELAILAGGGRGRAAAPDRAALEDLLRAFPDETRRDPHGRAVEPPALAAGPVGLAAGRADRAEAIDPIAADSAERKTLGFHAGDEEFVVGVGAPRADFNAGDVVAAVAAGLPENFVAAAAQAEIQDLAPFDGAAGRNDRDRGEEDDAGATNGSGGRNAGE